MTRPSVVLAAIVAAVGVLTLPTIAFAAAQIQEPEAAIANSSLEDFDARSTVAPSAAQRATAADLGSVRWNRLGTPQSIVRHGGFIAQGVQAPSASAAAREWLTANRAVFGLGSLDSVRLDRAVRLPFSKGYAVIFRQEFGGLETASDSGTASIGVVGSAAAGWKIGYVSSSFTRDTGLAGTASLSAEGAWVKAAADLGRPTSVVSVDAQGVAGDWKLLDVAGLIEKQRARLVGFATPKSGVVPAYETIYAGNDGSAAYKHVVDARNGNVLLRQNLVHNAAQEDNAIVPQPPFSGEVPDVDAACGPRHGPYTVATAINAIDVFAAATVPTNDVVLNLYRGTAHIVSADTLLSPEAIHYSPTGGVPPGDYFVEVCDFRDHADWTEPRTYAGTVTFDDAPPSFAYPPRWKVFPATPQYYTLPHDPWNIPDTDTRKTWCWDANLNGVPVAGCEGETKNLASRAPWDHDIVTNSPTNTTLGNNANTYELWVPAGGASAPGFTQFRPVNAARNYSFPWTNEWEVQDCPGLGAAPGGVPTVLVPGVSLDISAAVTNLFVAHNRMHDWAYFLGHTEETWNAQAHNFGLTNKAAENDPVHGRSQAGAITGSRNNANMATFPDGQSPITNMFLWQPQSAAFYAPCVDGDYDMQIIGHEFGHMIENRLIGKGAGRNEHHAGAMGESYGDLFGMEYVNEHGFVPVNDENRYSVGAYATGNKQRAIRNYGMNFPYSGDAPRPSALPTVNALNFSAMGYDLTGPQVHADGEIWSATNFEIRQALNAKYDAAFPSSNTTLQSRCANGEIPPDLCPGNRRWVQLVFDSMLLMPIAPSMLDARDAMLAADTMRFGGANQGELWLAFAHRGFGKDATSTNSDENTDTDPTPSFESPLHGSNVVTFDVTTREGGNTAIPGARIYVGHFEAGVSPIADTDAATTGPNLDATAGFADGVYEMTVHAPGYGHVRFRLDLSGGGARTIHIRMPTNYASKAQGASASGDVNLQNACFGPPTIPAPECTRETDADRQASLDALIDDTESTMWERMEAVDAAPGANGPVVVDGTTVTVDLAGAGAVRVNRVQVSSMLKPFIRELPLAGAEVLFNPNRFTALRAFAIAACNAASADCSSASGYVPVYSSPADAFPSGPPRPVSPEMLIRNFDIPETSATHLRLIVRSTQCTGEPAFQGDQDSAPANPDCDAVAQRANLAAFVAGTNKAGVRAAEFQAFTTTPVVTGPAQVTPPAPPPPAPPAPQPPTSPPPPQPTPPPTTRRPVQAARCTVPKATGKKLAAARKAIAARRCRVGKVRNVNSRLKKGVVLSQSVRAGRRVRVGTRVNLVVSRGVRTNAAGRRAGSPRFTG